MKFLFFLPLFFSISFLQAQEKVEKISISVENATLEELFSEIENQTSYEFYYLENWLGNKRISVDFKEKSLNEILAQVLESSMLNFYVLDSRKVILTQNNIIYDELPAGFFPQREEVIVEEIPEEIETKRVNPLFYNNRQPSEVETVRIGRETRNSYGQKFTLKGRVTEDETGEPIPNLAILIEGSNVGTVTDENGEYEIQLPAGLNILETKRVNPLFYNNRQPSEVETVRIGRETRNSYGQKFTLKGRVTEDETGEPIPNLAILIEGSNVGT
ncbi:MAG TPA: carboxypeptidase-like regulatory domain-containing protein, partial [Salinimicrobium sp.]|nr:carboxypeptidase-like regulatory domain-containing protein [Salinimicrobium sp.]